MPSNFFIDIAYRQQNCRQERICGDTFVYKRIASENYTILVLSDGMGHGVKANVLSTLTASMLLNLVGADTDIQKIAELVLKTLPVCSVRRISYSTFTIVYIDHQTGAVTIAEHDNPQSMLFRRGKSLVTEWDCVVMGKQEHRLQTILTTKFTAQEGDRIVFMSDGITQSGLGSEQYPFGWGSKLVTEFIRQGIVDYPEIGAREIASKLLSRAIENDRGVAQDDTSCVVVHIRRPKRLLLSSCPPSSRAQYRQFAQWVQDFQGKKVICGYPIAEIIAAELELPVVKPTLDSSDALTSVWEIPGFELVTEGILTLNKAYDMLEHMADLQEGMSASDRLCRMLLDSDEINILIGTKRGAVNGYLPDEFELRRNILRRLGTLLEQKFMKEVNISYL